MKNKNQNKKTFKKFIIYYGSTGLLITLGLVQVIDYSVAKTKQAIEFIKNPVPVVSIADISVPQPEKELPMREWVKQEIEKAGLDWEEVDCLIKNESNWNQWATNWNTNGSIDYGLWAINSIHKKTISVKDRYDYKTATKWAINKRLHDGNWSAWYGFKKCK